MEFLGHKRVRRSRRASLFPIAVEATLELARARLSTMFWRKTIFDPLPPVSGSAVPNPAVRAPATPETNPEDIAIALEAAVDRAAQAVPFRAVCLQRALALRRMLHRRGVASVLRLGIAPDQVSDAHAWLIVNGRIVAGAEGVGRFHPIAEFP